MSEPTQIPLQFDHRPSLSGDDFLVAPGNRTAVDWIDAWPAWPSTALVICGPPGCGKSHLVEVFRARGGVQPLHAADLATADPESLIGAAQAWTVDDAEAAIRGTEESFLHLYNLLREAGGHLLLTAERPPARWRIALPDLRSRLATATVAEIAPPDDGLMAAVLVKLFADRQLRVGTEVVLYMTRHMERSFETARRLVAAIDTEALAGGRRITVPLVRTVIEREARQAEGGDHGSGTDG